MNKNLIWGVLILVVLAVGAYLYLPKYQSPTSTTPTTSSVPVSKNTVTIKNFAFAPSTLTVKVGDTVSWVNEDLTGHSATADQVTFDTGVFEQNDSKSVTFDQPGTFTYHCTVHPNMKGKIIVEQ